jgi:hypothetical protein
MENTETQKYLITSVLSVSPSFVITNLRNPDSP